MTNRRVLITGAAGFLGSNLAQRYLDSGDSVYGIDNFSSSKKNSPHLKSLQMSNHFQFHRMDICDDEFKELIREIEPDLILNFACPASPPIYQRIPLETLRTCTVGVSNILETIASMRSKHFSVSQCIVVHASTSEVYGDPQISPQPESYRGQVNTWGPRANYDEGKRVAETLCYEYLKKNVDVRVVRIFNTYGPNMDLDDGRVVTNFLKQAIKGKDITVYGDGNQTRSFCYVDDLIDGIMRLADLSENPQSPVNIGNPGEFTIFELATMAIDQSNSTSKIIHETLPIDDPMQRCPDITRARALLNWEPKVSLYDGLAKMISYVRSIA